MERSQESAHLKIVDANECLWIEMQRHPTNTLYSDIKLILLV